ncbi:MAG: HK97 family phage prohead protease [Oscillospiraceae bacterium]|nr:HK97 family phage prohead protease [Oscillospiraceae bacterium]
MPNLTELEQSRLNDGREYRSIVMEARDDEFVVEGYATTFNQPYLLWGDKEVRVYEQIASGAFDDCDMQDVIMQYNHLGRVFARTRNNTLQLTVDGTGLKIRATLGGTDLGKQVYEEIKGGYTDKMSMGFRVEADERTEVRDASSGIWIVTRTITKVKKLYDVSAVSMPANDMTSISARMLADGAIEAAAAERLRRENKKQKIKTMLEVFR